jgi:hypothetical protein
MKVIIRTWEDNDYLAHQSMSINEEEVLSVHPLSECPEDAIIGRDLVDCNQVLSLMSKAYLAGKEGEKFTVEYLNTGEEE